MSGLTVLALILFTVIIPILCYNAGTHHDAEVKERNQRAYVIAGAYVIAFILIYVGNNY